MFVLDESVEEVAADDDGKGEEPADDYSEFCVVVAVLPVYHIGYWGL